LNFNKSKTADGCHLKIEKPRYTGNGMTDLQEIWHGIFAKFGALKRSWLSEDNSTIKLEPEVDSQRQQPPS